MLWWTKPVRPSELFK